MMGNGREMSKEAAAQLFTKPVMACALRSATKIHLSMNQLFS